LARLLEGLSPFSPGPSLPSQRLPHLLRPQLLYQGNLIRASPGNNYFHSKLLTIKKCPGQPATAPLLKLLHTSRDTLFRHTSREGQRQI